MDAILARMEQVGWTMGDLDEESGTGQYFRSGEWRKHPPRFAHMAKAVSALDGTFEVVWKVYPDD
jgi:hypothetical protein